jgi:leucyl-tRNA synthetase
MDYIESLASKLRNNKTKHERIISKAFKKTYYADWVKEQVVIGNYIVDFLIPQKRLIIEIDGSYHKELENRAKDILRDAYFKKIYLNVLRFTNEDIENNLNNVIKIIDNWARFEDEDRNKRRVRGMLRKQKKLRRRGKLNYE